ncbi:MAG: energy transducer TonB [Gammaproteobacteria bacterium]|nr:energy transducer TonB [Gammaproteobacteria bacterium]MYF37957.1 energy transducer TonB [Gammaproteobacteria bacterium]
MTQEPQNQRRCLSLLSLVLYATFMFAPLGCVSTSYQPFALISWDDLVYPEEAKRSKITGSVTVQYDIQIDGTVANVSVVEAEPPDVFDAEALRYVRSWVFRPAKKAGAFVVTENVESEITFKLADQMEDPPDY